MGSGLRERPAEEGAEEEAESRGVLPLVPGDYGEPRKDPPRALRGTGLCCPPGLGTSGLKNWEGVHFCCFQPPDCGPPLGLPEGTNTETLRPRQLAPCANILYLSLLTLWTPSAASNWLPGVFKAAHKCEPLDESPVVWGSEVKARHRRG